MALKPYAQKLRTIFFTLYDQLVMKKQPICNDAITTTLGIDELVSKFSTTILLTSSEYIAKHYLFNLERQLCKSFPTFFPTPTIYQLYTWIRSIYQTGNKAIITTAKKQLIFSNIIAEKNTSFSQNELIYIVKKSIEALECAQLWLFSDADLASEYVCEDISLLFLLEKYNSYCNKFALIDTIGIIKEVTNSIQSNITLIKKDIITIGIEHPPCLIRELFTAIKSQTKLSTLSLNKQPQNINWYACDNAITSYQEFAAWSQNCSGTIGLLVPQLSHNIFKVKQNMAAAFGCYNYSTTMQNQQYSITDNTALAQHAIIAITLKLIALTEDKLKLTDIIAVINSNYLFNQDINKIIVTNYLNKQRMLNDHYLSFHDVFVIIIQLSSQTDAALGGQILAMFRLIKSFHDGECDEISFFADILTITAWPGNISEYECKVVTKFNSIMRDIKYSVCHDKKLSRYRSLNSIVAILKSYSVLAHQQNCSIQVIDVNEASFCSFDNVWVMGMDEINWPTTKKYPPITKNLLEKYKVLQEDNHICQAIINRIVNGSRNIMLNYESIINDQSVKKSAMVKAYCHSENKFIALNKNNNPYHKFTTKNSLSKRLVPTKIPLQQHEKNIGTYQLKEFQNCNIRSFIKYRLRAPEYEEASLGFNAKEKGIIIHEVLQRFYQLHPSHECLIQLAENTIVEELGSILEIVITELINDNRASINKVYILNEIINMQSIMLQWLLHEKERPFFEIAHLEHKQTLSVYDININMVIDRIDRLAAGKLAIIDYKTGQCSMQNWFGSKIKDPQMPIYALNYSNVAVIAFAKINQYNSAFNGVATDEHFIAGTKVKLASEFENIAELTSYWHTEIYKIVADYKEGLVAANPDNIKLSCGNCQYASICRIWEQGE